MANERDQHVCPNGHEVPVLTELACHCGARVAYEPCSIGMALDRDLRAALEDAKDADEASLQAAFWRARAVELGASEDEYRNTHGGQ
jgi:hypothetical protein